MVRWELVIFFQCCSVRSKPLVLQQVINSSPSEEDLVSQQKHFCFCLSSFCLYVVALGNTRF